MKLKADITIPRPKGTWEIKRWNLLRGETEEDVEATVQNNFMTDACAIAGLMRNVTGTFTPAYNGNLVGISVSGFTYAGETKRLLLEGGLTPEDTRDIAGIASAISSNGQHVYFFPTGVTGTDVGKEVKALGAFGRRNSSVPTNVAPSYLLNLQTPIVLEEGDVLKVTFTAELPTAVSSGTINIPSTSYAYGEDPEDSDAGTAGTSFTGSLEIGTDFFSANPVLPFRDAQVKRNGDGSLEFESPIKLTYKSPTSSVSGNPSNISNITFASYITFTFNSPYPQQLPGSYYEVELDLNIKIAPVS